MVHPRNSALAAALFLSCAFLPQGALASASTAPASVGAGALTPSGDVISPQDTLQVSVFQVDDLNRTVVVDSDGKISLPLIGIVQVAGKSTSVVADEIANKLRDGYVLSPQVSVLITASPSQHVTVEGQVEQPGVYPLSGHTTLLEAVAMARGVNAVADERRVAVIRVIDNRRAIAMYDLSAIRTGKSDDPEIRPNDVIVLEKSGAKSMFSNIRSIIPIVGIFRWF
jgi:polysaccharide export outer membrane protein